nr:Ig-like domain-containing protein [Brevibacillus laterosporus]
MQPEQKPVAPEVILKQAEEAVAAYEAAALDTPDAIAKAEALGETAVAKVSAVADADKKAALEARVAKKKAAVDAAKAGDLVVESVSAINGVQLEVKFSREVDETAAQTATNYTIASSEGTAVTLKADAVKLQDDNKTAIITLTNAVTEKTTFVVTVKPILLKDSTTVKSPIFTNTVVVEDKIAPTVTEISSVTAGATASKITIKYSEPVINGIIKINGESKGPVAANATTQDIVVDLDATKTHTLEIINLTDAANNVTPILTKTFTVTMDANAPEATVAAKGDKKILVTFNKAMKPTTVAGAISVKDEAYNNVNIGTISPVDTTNKTFEILVTDPLYANKASRTLTLVFNDKMEDELGNKAPATTKTVTLNKDTVAPSFEGVKVKKDTDGKATAVVVSFSEELQAGTFDASQLIIIDGDGVKKTNFLKNGTLSTDKKEVTFELTTAAKHSGVYSITFPAGFVKDTAEVANLSEAKTVKVDFGKESVDDSKFEIEQSDVDASNNVITVDFGTAVKGGEVAGSATDVNNYSLNQKALPAGTTITLDAAKQKAEISLPKESIAKSDANALFTVTNVQSSTGKTIEPFTGFAVVKDNVSPALESARILDNKTIELTFSEDMAALTADAQVGEDFVITQGSTALSLTKGELVANKVSGFDTKIKIAINKPGTAGTPETPEIPGSDATAKVTGANASIATIADATTATEDGSHDYTVEENGSDLEVKEGSKVVATLDASGDGTFVVGGVTVNVKGAVKDNEFTVETKAKVDGTPAVPGTPGTPDTTLDLKQAITVETKASATVKDLEGNTQKAGVKVDVSK